MNTFSLIGAAGYVAPKHMKAINEIGGKLLAVLDPFDSVGIIDSFFPEANFFTEFERFDRYIDKLRRQAVNPVNYISICSPNYLHDSHIRFSLRSGADAICEKPLVLNPWNLDGLKQIEDETGRKINTILQLRLHPAILKLKEKIIGENKVLKYDVDLTYVASRGNWYLQSWKGIEEKSGGVATNIGIHFFDMLHFLFGKFQRLEIHWNDPTKAAGYIEYEKARVRWMLSLNYQDIPMNQRYKDQRTYRSITIDGNEINFTAGFNDLHVLSYKEIMANRGFGVEESRTAVEIVALIRNGKLIANPSDPHPLLRKI